MTLIPQYNYNSITGHFIRMYKTSSSHKIGVPLGLYGKRSCAISINKIRKELTHWIWYYQTGEFPSGVVDHIDGNQQNNCWENLRVVSQATNLANKHIAQSNNKLKILGVDFINNKYRARLKRPDFKSTHLGMYDTAKEAHQAYLNERQKYSPIKGVENYDHCS